MLLCDTLIISLIRLYQLDFVTRFFRNDMMSLNRRIQQHFSWSVNQRAFFCYRFVW